jgi:hypothetical protein
LKDRAGDLATGNSHLAAEALLVGLGAANGYAQTFGRLFEVLDVECHQLGAPEGTREAKQDDGAIAERAKRRSGGAHGNDHVRGRGSLAHGGGADRAPNAAQRRLYGFITGRAVMARGAVEVADGGQAAPERAGAPPDSCLVGQEAAQRRSGGG